MAIKAAAGTTRPAGTRAEKKEATRRQLVAATIDSIAASGFADTTLSKVAERAGVSRGLVNFHFDSKERLLVETLRHLTEEYRQSWLRAIQKERGGPAAKLVALVQSDFHPQVCNRKKIAVWYAFWGEAKSRPIYRDISATADVEFADTLEALCRQLGEEGGYRADPLLVSKGLRTMIDGLWLECLMSPQAFSRDLARRTCMAFLAAVYPRHFAGNELDTQAAADAGSPADDED